MTVSDTGTICLIVFGIIAALCLGSAFFLIGKNSGKGYTPYKVEKITERLKKGVVYQLISSYKIEENSDYVLFVKKLGFNDFYAIHVGRGAPAYFALDEDGELIEIVWPPGK